MKDSNRQGGSSKKQKQEVLGSRTALNLDTSHGLKDINNQKKPQGEESNGDEEQSCFMAPIHFISDFLDIYATGERKDTVMMVIGILLALCSGISFPLVMYFWGKEVDHLTIDYFNLANTMDISLHHYLAFIGIAVGSFFLDGIVFAFWKVLSEKTAYRYRVSYMQAFTKRKMAWLQQLNLFETSSKFKLDCLVIEKATGDKVALFYNLNGLIIAGVIAALCVRWTFALYLIAMIPFGLAMVGYFIYVLIMRKMDSRRLFEKAEGQSMEAGALIRTVKMMQAERYQQQIYNRRLEEYKGKISAYPLKLAISTGIFFFIQSFTFGVGYLYGVQCVRGTSACPVQTTGSHYTIGDLHIVFYEIYICTYYLLQLASNFDAIHAGIQSSKDINRLIKQTQEEQQTIPTNVIKQTQQTLSVEDIELKGVTFAYPSNPNRKILRNLSFKPLKNKFNAVVGATGAGKSTIAQLLLKFYEADEGHIFVGGRDITDVDAGYLRDRIGFVGQEPTLFSGTLRQNVAIGKPGVADQEIWDVLRKVNLRDFVMSLPQKLDYDVGIAGQKLSGGQKQRVAIARALIKKPSLLILDEATSALDRKSQRIIQRTFEQMFLKTDLDMTVICIAHRVRTIVKADRIFCLEGGSVKEQGTFRELSYFRDVELPPQEATQCTEGEETVCAVRQERQLKATNDEQQQYSGNVYWKLLQYTQQKGKYALSLFLALLNGFNHPAAFLLVCYVLTEQEKLIMFGRRWNWCPEGSPQACTEQMDSYHITAVKYAAGIIGFAFYTFFPNFVQVYLLTKIEEEITHNLRKKVFQKLMVMPVPWYERPENEGGQAASRAGVDVKAASTLVTVYVPLLLTNITTMGGGIALCIGYLWQIGLLSLFSIPLIGVGCWVSVFFIGGYEDDTLHRHDESDKLACEVIVSIKTVTSLNCQQLMLQKYMSLLEDNPLESFKRGLKIGFFFGFSVFIILMSIGSNLFASDHVMASLGFTPELINVVVSIYLPVWCGWVGGNSFFFVSNQGGGKKSAQRIFQLLELTTEAQLQQHQEEKKLLSPLPSQIRGRIEFKAVSFRYTPQSKYVLRDVNLVIEAGSKTAIVGESGSGKSTLILLLQRFYEFEGEITLDGVSIFDYDLASYRRYFAVLNQEPSLFSGAIHENVQLGSTATEAEVSQACQITFAYDVNRVGKEEISIQQSVKEFLDRDAGAKGAKVSGGEKQRIACARAVLRAPRIFLMDEGTSALDRKTEKRLQQNIDSKLSGVTTVNVAHRMETIENSDVIYLIEDGRMVESGKYREMMERKAFFHKFVNGSRFIQQSEQSNPHQ